MPRRKKQKPEPFFARRIFAPCGICGELFLNQHLKDHVAAHYRLEYTLVERFPKQCDKNSTDKPEDPFAALGGRNEGTAA